MAKESRTDILMLSLKALHHLSHLMGLASPQMSTLTALRGSCSRGDEAGVPAANGTTCLVAFCWLPLEWGPRSSVVLVNHNHKYYTFGKLKYL